MNSKISSKTPTNIQCYMSAISHILKGKKYFKESGIGTKVARAKVALVVLEFGLNTVFVNPCDWSRRALFPTPAAHRCDTYGFSISTLYANLGMSLH